MSRTGVLEEILPDADLSRFLAVQMPEKTNLFPPKWPRRFYALQETYIPFPHANSEQDHLYKIAEALDNDYSIAVSTYLYGKLVAKDVHALRGSCGGWDYAEADRGESAVFPVRATDLMQLGVGPGPEMGKMLKDAKSIWLKTGLVAEKDDLLEQVAHGRV